MKDECLICNASLEYLYKAIEMKCVMCGKIEMSGAKCTNGHYVCNECHTCGVDSILGACMNSTSDNPFEIFNLLIRMPFCHMHGPEHHIIVGASILTAYKNAGGKLDLTDALIEMQRRGKQVPGGACGFWGACGAGVSSGIAISIITGATPLTKESWGLANSMTSRALKRIGDIGGPRCCKRNSYLAIDESVVFILEALGIELTPLDIKCSYLTMNNQCIGSKCPFNVSTTRRDKPL